MLAFIFAHVVVLDVAILTAVVAVAYRKYKHKKALDAFRKEFK